MTKDEIIKSCVRDIRDAALCYKEACEEKRDISTCLSFLAVIEQRVSMLRDHT